MFHNEHNIFRSINCNAVKTMSYAFEGSLYCIIISAYVVRKWPIVKCIYTHFDEKSLQKKNKMLRKTDEHN